MLNTDLKEGQQVIVTINKEGCFIGIVKHVSEDSFTLEEAKVIACDPLKGFAEYSETITFEKNEIYRICIKDQTTNLD